MGPSVSWAMNFVYWAFRRERTLAFYVAESTVVLTSGKVPLGPGSPTASKNEGGPYSFPKMSVDVVECQALLGVFSWLTQCYAHNVPWNREMILGPTRRSLRVELGGFRGKVAGSSARRYRGLDNRRGV